ncbi:MAG: radical SAM protein [Deferribacterales bacterium]
MTSNILPVFISFSGCRQRCVYCNQNSITGQRPGEIISSAENQIRKYLEMSTNWDEIAFYGGSFTCLSPEIRKKLYDMADNAGIKSKRFSTSPDCVNDDVMREAEERGVLTVEIGVQSLDDEVLKANNRPCDAHDTIESVKTAKKYIRKVACQIMTGMYKENFRSFQDTVDKIIELTPEYVRIYPCVVLRDTELNRLYESGEYVPLPLEESLARSAYGLILLEAAGIDVIRIGLQDADDLKSAITAGAYHPAAGDMAKTIAFAVYYGMGHSIETDSRYMNVALGYGGYNKEHRDGKVIIKEGAVPSLRSVCEKIAEYRDEDYKRYIQRETARHAQRLVSQTDNG